MGTRGERPRLGGANAFRYLEMTFFLTAAPRVRII